ncbi:hypothetical protein Ami103574_08295 [Aminipila butyrica]|uniref:Uncharacterized protein n=1 Tax=Aminipila butyrica TaxID=433296 RepID=A0A858BTR3_9FIRM|nr:hypothetical protein [Aminipila butyrica]QIB69323.1 hypothetical protein Ami103574_08295 [Aminipila butyrica]
MINNLILRNGIAFLLIMTLIFSGSFLYPGEAYAQVVEKLVTKYHLDIGVQQIWGTEDKYGTIIWDDDVGPGGSMYVSTSIPLPKEVYNVKAYQYSSKKFDWNDSEHYTSNMTSIAYYEDNYEDYAASSITVYSAVPSGKTVNFSYNASMSSKRQYDLTQKLNDIQINEVFQLMAGPYSKNPEEDVKKGFPDLYKKLNVGRNGVDKKVHAYMFFTPVILQYDVKEMVEIPDPDPESLIADLEAPKEAKKGEDFKVLDACRVGEKTKLAYAELYRKVDDGPKELIATWEGTGGVGKNTGQSISQFFLNECTVVYEIKGVTISGLSDTASITVNVIDGRQIGAKAVLELDPYTYEGHPADAEDWSEFTVDGDRYSAKRAYEEKLASNKFKTEGGSIKKDGYDAIVTYPKKGFYPVNLEVTIKSTREKLTDTKNIEVRKTPYVMDNLGGFQKQNRKQILTFNIATYPDKPITDYDITIKDLKSNEVISLTKDAPQENGACIKTRQVDSEVQNTYWTKLTVEFLTKYPRYSLTGEESRRFSYRIKVTDSKGDTDEAYKEFDVAPDKPPFPAINMQTVFLRAQGTNTAELKAEDASQSDGDQLLRTWSLLNYSPLDQKKIGDFTKATQAEGYENLAFGTNQAIGWKKDGVGKTAIKLHVKDIWIEPTLEEYITPADYLEGEITADTEVINIAPQVSIEPLETLKANIAILVKKNQYSKFKNAGNELNAALLEKGLDGQVSLIPVAETSEETGVTSRLSIPNADGTGGVRIADSKYIYFIAPVILGDGTANGGKIQAVDEDGKTAWSYLLPEKSTYYHKLYIDQKEKYLVYSYGYDSTADSSGKYTLLFDSQTGALLATLPEVSFSSGSKVFLSGDGNQLYIADEKGIQRLAFKTGKLTRILKEELYEPRIEKGKLGFIGKMADAKYYIGRLDLTSEELDKTALPMLDYKNPLNLDGMSSLKPVDWDGEGRVLVVRRFDEYSDGANGGEVWILNSKTQSQTHVHRGVGDDKGWNAFLIKDKDGIADYFGISYGHKGTSKFYNDVELYKSDVEKASESPLVASWDSGKVGTTKLANRGYYDRDQGLIYAVGVEYYGRVWVYNLNTGKWEVESGSLGNLGLEDLSNSITSNLEVFDGRLVNMYYGQDLSSAPMYLFTQSKLPITAEQSAYNGLAKQGEFESRAENYVVNLAFEEPMEKVRRYAQQQGAALLDMDLGGKIADIAEQIAELGKQAKYRLHLIGGGSGNTASAWKDFVLEGNTQYEYSYDMQVVSGSAVDVFQAEKNPAETVNGTPVYKEIVYQADLTNGESSYITDGFVTYEKGVWFNRSKYGENGYGGGQTSKSGNTGGPSLSFTMEKDGYLQLDMANDCYGYNSYSRSVWVDGLLAAQQTGDTQDYGKQKTTFFIFLTAGKHKVESTAEDNDVHNVMKAIEIGYFSSEDNTMSKEVLTSSPGDTIQRVTGQFTSPKVVTYSQQESASLRVINLWDLQNAGNVSLRDCGNGWVSISGDGQSVTTGCNHYSSSAPVICYIDITAPADKMLWISYNQEVKLLGPSEKFSAKYSVKGGLSYTHIKDFKAVEIPLGTLDISAASPVSLSEKSPCIKYTIKNEDSNLFYKMSLSGSTALLSKCQTRYAPDISARLSFTAPASSSLGSILLSDFTLKSVYSKLNAKGTVYENRFNHEDSLEGWQTSVKGSGRAEMALAEPGKKEEDAPLVYKKGQLVKYNIYYSDYEADLSKSGYWLYAHTPYNDGEHPEAAILYDEDGNIKSICGQAVTPGAVTIDDALSIAKRKGLKILEAPIDRFYVDGKYTVYHWEYDDTSRGLVSGGYPAYDKESNTADLTFYVEGRATAPWITGISTSPAKVTENNYFSINIGIDDLEKDVLSLTTEVYKDKKLIYTHRKKNILPLDDKGREVEFGGYEYYGQVYTNDPNTGQAKYFNAYRYVDQFMAKTGEVVRGYNETTRKIESIAVSEKGDPIKYPVINTGALPDKALAGTYEVVCTVRDQTGAGLGTYKFIVVSEGKIIGEVYHTEQWDINRKKYNLGRFKEEINRSIAYSDYLKLKEPRTRGTNVFWSGEKFMLQAAVAGSPTKVTCAINGTSYSTAMKNSGKKNAAGETIYTGSLWDKAMISKWGRKEPVELTFTFTASYSGGITKRHEVNVIVDNMDDYWKLHRVF